MVQAEMGWTNALLRRQLWKAFDVQGVGEIGFKDFAKGYSTLVRGTVPELVAFAWRMYHLSGDDDLLQPANLYIILKLAMSAQHSTPSTSTPSTTTFPSPSRPSSPTLFTSSKPSSKQPSATERAARSVVESALGGSRAPLTRSEFKRLVLRERRFVDCILPAFEWIPQVGWGGVYACVHVCVDFLGLTLNGEYVCLRVRVYKCVHVACARVRVGLYLRGCMCTCPRTCTRVCHQSV
eukprot:jgi/Chlat1/7997/Chrsp7S07776